MQTLLLLLPMNGLLLSDEDGIRMNGCRAFAVLTFCFGGGNSAWSSAMALRTGEFGRFAGDHLSANVRDSAWDLLLWIGDSAGAGCDLFIVGLGRASCESFFF